MTGVRASLIGVLAIVGSVAPSACGVGDEGVPADKVAVVGDKVFGPEDLSGVQTQLGPYAQLRFAGNEGRAALVEALVAAELMAQEAIDEGLGDDPRVEWAVQEEQAALYLAAELERRVPWDEVARDTEALRAWYDAHPEEFWSVEQRNLEGLVFDDYGAAEEALAKLRSGETTLLELGEVIATPLHTRDDQEHPTFHPILFDPTVGAGDWLPGPVMVAGKILVGRVQQLVPAKRSAFEDPAVQERIVREVRAPRVAAAREALLAELAERYPEGSIGSE